MTKVVIIGHQSNDYKTREKDIQYMINEYEKQGYELKHIQTFREFNAWCSTTLVFSIMEI